MLPQCFHITRKRGVFYYRRRLGCGLSGEVAISLRTRRFPNAEWLARLLDQQFSKAVSEVQKKVSEGDISRYVKEYLKRALDHDMWDRARSHVQPLFGAVTEAGESVKSVDLDFVERELKTARSELANRQYGHQQPLIDDLMEEYGIPREMKGTFALGVLRARVEMWEIIRKRTLGEFPPIEDDGPAIAVAPVKSSGVRDQQDSSPGPLLSQILPVFLSMMEKDQGWRGQTLAQAKATFRMFMECCGDRPVTQYQRRDLTAFYDVLRSLPALYSKDKRWSGLPLAQIAEQARQTDDPKMTMKTVKRHFSALGRLFTWLRKRGEYLKENPAHEFEFPDKRRARDKRKMWQGERLERLFKSPLWTGCLSATRRSMQGSLIVRDEKYWLPILGLFQGNRLEEFAQLRRGDVRKEDDVWFLDINDEDGKQLKNQQSKRRVPLHPRLIVLGFLDYVEDVAPMPDSQVFPNLQRGGPDGKLGYRFTKWWTRYRREIDLYERGLDYHSFRASVSTKLAAMNVSLDLRNELLGREGTSVDERVYQKGLPLKILAEAIARVDWPEFDVRTPYTRGELSSAHGLIDDSKPRSLASEDES
jgi:hypothetical protein